MDQALCPWIERGVVISYFKRQCFGFLQLDTGGDLFFHKSRLDKIGLACIFKGTRVTFVRGVDRDNREQVDHFLEVDGRPVTPTNPVGVKIEAVLDDRPAMASSQKPPSPLKVKEVPLRPAVQTKVRPTPPEAEWIGVQVRKLRAEHTTYAESDMGTVLVPWPVFLRARVKSLPRDEHLEARCKRDGENLIATEIRRR